MECVLPASSLHRFLGLAACHSRGHRLEFRHLREGSAGRCTAGRSPAGRAGRCLGGVHRAMGVVDAAFHCGRVQIDPDVAQPRRKPGAGAPLCARAVAPHRHARAPAAGPDRGPGGGAHPAGRQRRSGAPAHRCVGPPRPAAGGYAGGARQRAAARRRAAARAAGGGLGGPAVQAPADRRRHRAGGRGRRRQEPGGRHCSRRTA